MPPRGPPAPPLRPMPDSGVDTIVAFPDGARLHFQEWWTRHRATLAPARFENPGIEAATAAPGVVEAISEADVVLLGRAALREPSWPLRAAHELGLALDEAPWPPQHTRGAWR